MAAIEDTVSIIIPTYNRRHILPKVLDSYLCQKNLHELMFVDDASTDGTYEYLKEIEKSFPVVKVIKQERNLGHPTARNTAISVASGRYIMFGEDDVYLASDYLSTLLVHIKKSNADLISGRILYLMKKESFEECLARHNVSKKDIMNYWLMSPNWSKKVDEDVEIAYIHSISLGRTEVYRHIRFDHTLFAREGTDFCARAGKEGYKIVFCPHTACFHLPRDKGKGGTWKVGVFKYQILASRDNNKLIDKHYGHFKRHGMKGNKFTFKLLHLINRVRLLYLYFRDSTKHSRKKYKIAYLMHGARNVGGGERSIYLLIKYLRRDIFDVIVFYTHENEIIKKIKGGGVKTVKIALHKDITSVYRDEIKIDIASLFTYTIYFFDGIYKVAKLLRKYEVDIIHPHDNLSKLISGVAAKITGVKTVAHCRDILERGLVGRFLIYYQVLFMDRIIAVSESNRNLLRVSKRLLAKVHTIYNGIDFDEFDCLKSGSISRDELGIRDGNVVLGSVGMFDKCKGHIYLLKAIKRLVDKGTKNIYCLIVGDGREVENLKRFVIDNNIQDYVRFVGYREDVPMILKVIDIVVMPSTHESFPRVPLEAMASKLPVVATNIGGLPELIEDGCTGILVPPEDVGSLGDAIKYLVENPELRKKMGKAGRKRAEERFVINSNVRKTEALYLGILENS